MWKIAEGSTWRIDAPERRFYWLQDDNVYPADTRYSGIVATFTEAEILCDQFNIRDYGRVGDVASGADAAQSG